MVIIKPVEPTAQIAVDSLLRLNSSRCLRYVAPLTVATAAAAAIDSEIVAPMTKRSEYTSINDAWEGVSELCRALDDIQSIENESELLIGRRVLELGFATGLPAVLALDSGAAEVTIHTTNKLIREAYIKPSMARNAVPPTLCKFTSSADLRGARAALGGGKRYDVILAPELLATDEGEFGCLHDTLDAVLADDGVVLLMSRSFYPDVSGSIQAFLDIVKMRGRFDAFARWSSTKTELGARKLIQLSRR